MATTRSAPELREFIKEHDQRVFDFCAYLLDGGPLAEETTLSIFHDFATKFRRWESRRPEAWDPAEARVMLFQLAWVKISDALGRREILWPSGRDTRQFQHLGEDLIKRWDAHQREGEGMHAAVLERLSRVDPDFRAPIVLRDILGFSDEEVVRILSVRWGVFRHRLHRGRLEMRDSLRGDRSRSPGAGAP